MANPTTENFATYRPVTDELFRVIKCPTAVGLTN